VGAAFNMAKILVFLDERSFFITELSGPAGPTAQAINAGKLPDGLSIPAAHKRDGRLAAFQHGELVVVIWKGAAVTDPAAAQPSPPVLDLPETALPLLTLRETQVLQSLADGLTNKQIAKRLKLTDRTIRVYVNSLKTKLGTQSAEQSVGKGVMLGLCRLPPRPVAQKAE
jgi:DNA-binding CsgD family transcriptional regulator